MITFNSDSFGSDSPRMRELAARRIVRSSIRYGSSDKNGVFRESMRSRIERRIGRRNLERAALAVAFVLGGALGWIA